MLKNKMFQALVYTILVINTAIATNETVLHFAMHGLGLREYYTPLGDQESDLLYCAEAALANNSKFPEPPCDANYKEHITNDVVKCLAHSGSWKRAQVMLINVCRTPSTSIFTVPEKQMLQIVQILTSEGVGMSSGKVIIYGGKGALGSTLLEYFKKNNYWTLNIAHSISESASANVLVDANASWVEQEKAILEGVAAAIDGKVDGIFCVAGGWAGGNAASADFIQNSDLMWKQSVWSSAIAARIAANHLQEGGILQLTGAAAAADGTPGMIAYGMAKAAVHQLVKSLAQEGSGLPTNSTVFAILPVTLDTPNNRKWMPNADHSTWTSMDWISDQFHLYLSSPERRPPTGSHLKLTTVAGNTTIITV